MGKNYMEPERSVLCESMSKVGQASGVGDGGGLVTLLLAGSCTVKNAIIANNYKGSGTSEPRP
jgi:hypothetical protein